MTGSCQDWPCHRLYLGNSGTGTEQLGLVDRQVGVGLGNERGVNRAVVDLSRELLQVLGNVNEAWPRCKMALCLLM